MKDNRKKEGGYVIVEATIVYPIAFLIFFLVFYAALFLYHRANLQASIENALIYYKSQLADNYIEVNQNGIEIGENEARLGNRLNTDDIKFKNPYDREIKFFKDGYNSITKNSEDLTMDFKKFLEGSYGIVLDDLEAKLNNFYIFQELKVKAVKKMNTGINLAFIGATDSIDIKVEAKVVLVDGDNIVRDVDFLAYLIRDTKIAEGIKSFKGKIVDGYEKIKSKIGIK